MLDNNDNSLFLTCAAINTIYAGFLVEVLLRFWTSATSQKLSESVAASISFNVCFTPFSLIKRKSLANTVSGDVLYLPVKTDKTYHFWTIFFISDTLTSWVSWRRKYKVYAKSSAIFELISLGDINPALFMAIINCVKLCLLTTFNTPSLRATYVDSIMSSLYSRVSKFLPESNPTKSANLARGNLCIKAILIISSHSGSNTVSVSSFNQDILLKYSLLTKSSSFSFKEL